MNKYRHPKSSLFLMEIMINVLFFTIFVTICLQLFFKAYLLSTDASRLHRAVTACTSIAEVYQSDTNGTDVLLTVYADSIALNDTIIIYYNENFLPCGKSGSRYRATIENAASTQDMQISFYDLKKVEVIYTLMVSSYAPMSLEALTGGGHT